MMRPSLEMMNGSVDDHKRFELGAEHNDFAFLVGDIARLQGELVH
jgi:hypothetical protein